MTRLEIQLPDATKEFIETQVSTGQFSTPSEYLGFLVEQARVAAAQKSLDDLLEDGLHSGPPIPFTSEWWNERKARLLATLPVEAPE